MVWDGTFIVTPRNFIARRTVDALAEEGSAGKEMAGRLPVSDILATFPVALLEVR